MGVLTAFSCWNCPGFTGGCLVYLTLVPVFLGVFCFMENSFLVFKICRCGKEFFNRIGSRSP